MLLPGFCAMKIGYARVSTDAQETHLQMDALKRVKCARIYAEKASGAKTERPELMKLVGGRGAQFGARNQLVPIPDAGPHPRPARRIRQHCRAVAHASLQ